MKRQRIRTGADEVRAWVRRLTLGNPYAKAVLGWAANYAHEDACAWPGLETLAKDTDLTQDTVLNRLQWCEEIGAIHLRKTWVDSNGCRNYQGRGRVTSTEIHFRVDLDPADISERAKQAKPVRLLRGAAGKKREAAEEAEICTRPGREQTALDLLPASTRVAPEQHSPGSRRIEEEEEGSEAYASGAVAPAEPKYSDIRHELFGEGVPILVSLGVSERQARSMIGRWLKDTHDDAQAVLGAIRRARDHRVHNPIPWITQGLKVKHDEQHNRTDRGKQTSGDFFAGIAKVAARLDRDGGVAEPAPEDIPLGRVNIDG